MTPKQEAAKVAAEVERVAVEDDLRATLIRTQRQLRKATAKTEMLIEATMQAAHDATMALGRIPAVVPPKKDVRKSPEASLWHITDLQGGKKTTTYNIDIMSHRVHKVVDKNIKLAEIHRTDHPVNHVCIAFGGDMVEGLFNFPSQPHEIMATLHEQWAKVSRLLIDVVRRALGAFQTVQVVAEYGNHGRIGPKRDGVPREDNIDRMCYTFARGILAEGGHGSRLVWNDGPEDIQRIEIGNYRALSIHGDEMGRNGFSSPPAIARWANDQRSGAYPWEFRDVYVGHYHSQIEMPMANGLGLIFFTGSTESGNRYAMNGMARGSVPSQRTHFIDPAKGRVTSRYTIWLD